MSLKDKRWMHVCGWRMGIQVNNSFFSSLFASEQSEGTGLLYMVVQLVYCPKTLDWRKQQVSLCSAYRVRCPSLGLPEETVPPLLLSPRRRLLAKSFCISPEGCIFPSYIKALWRPMDALKDFLRRHLRIHLEQHKKQLGNWRNGH